MAIYEYRCVDCGYEWEKRVPMTKSPAIAVFLICPKCRGSVERKFSAPNIIIR